jgi:riboflavin kinase / FMN adenylyltransferase
MSYSDHPGFIDFADNPFMQQQSAFDAGLRGNILAIGNFDGVHRGHRSIVDHARHLRDSLPQTGEGEGKKKSSQAKILVLTFNPHPRAFFQPSRALFHLLDAGRQKKHLAEAGFEGRVTLPFTAEMANLQAKAFVEEVLVARYAVRGIVVGADFHFGHKRAGTPDFLVAEGERLGFAVSLAPPLTMADGTIISSSAIRAALETGNVPRANAMLGYDYAISGTVIHGEKRGRELGYPTANIRLPAGNGLKHGIYAVFAHIDDVRHMAVASFGRRPTFDNGAPLLEVHIFDYADDLYGKTLEITFIAYLRGEEKFGSLEALIRQMDADSAQAREHLRASAGEPSHA